MKLTRDQFNRAVNNYITMSKQLENLCDAMGCYAENVFDTWQSYYYDLLTECCDFTEEDFDDYIGTILDYWCFELEFGAKYEEGCIKEDGTPIVLNTIDDVYDYIVKKQESKE